jgi:hypothetical protein
MIAGASLFTENGTLLFTDYTVPFQIKKNAECTFHIPNF